MKSFVPPRSDAMFKRVFANPEDLEPLRSFLGSVLDIPATDLATVTLTNTHLHPVHSTDKESIVDVRVRTATGHDINVEIQLVLTPGFPQRLVYYAANMLATQLHSGQSYADLAPVVTVAVTGFRLFDDDAFHHRFRMYDRTHGTDLADVFEVDVLELPKLKESSDGTLLWKWLRFIAAYTWEELEMVARMDSVIADAAAKVKFFSEEETLLIIHQQQEKRRRDELSRELYFEQQRETVRQMTEEAEEMKRQAEEARRQAEEARQQAEEARQQAEEVKWQTEEVKRQTEEVRQQVEAVRQQAEEMKRQTEAANERGPQDVDKILARGLEQGTRREKVSLARRMLTRGLPVAEVTDISGLSPKEVSALVATGPLDGDV